MGILNVRLEAPKLNIIVILLTLLCPLASAFWRLECRGGLGVGRIDPIVAPGRAASHVHTGHGAQTFGFDSTYDSMLASNCSSCTIIQDRSLYWTPALYFQHDNGSYQLVSQVDGMLAYYFNDNVNPPGVNLTAFPPGFRMIAGDVLRRNATNCELGKPMSFWNATDESQECLAAKMTGFNCLNYSQDPEGAMLYHYIRPKSFLDAHCPDGLRLEMQFPSCWDGKSLDSPDHKSHIMYPNLGKTGECPAGFEVRTPVLFYETIWNTAEFVNSTGQFVLSYGDPTGYGYHADFICGWKQEFLQSVINTCTNSSGQQTDCPLFDIEDYSIAAECKMTTPSALMEEDVVGPMPTLPGNVQIQYGPGYATIPSIGSDLGQSSSPSARYVSAPSQTLSNTFIPTSLPSSSASNQTLPSTSTQLHAPAGITLLSGIPVFTTTTSSFISNGVEVVMIIIEEIVTVTEIEAATAQGAKRHARKHVGGGHQFR